jgi:hypothetical protein
VMTDDPVFSVGALDRQDLKDVGSICGPPR